MKPKWLAKILAALEQKAKLLRDESQALQKSRKATKVTPSRKGKEKWVEPEQAPEAGATIHAHPGTAGSWQRRFLPSGRTQDQLPKVREEIQPLTDTLPRRDEGGHPFPGKIDKDGISEAGMHGISGLRYRELSEPERPSMSSPMLQIPRFTGRGCSSQTSSNAALLSTAGPSSMRMGGSSARVSGAQVPKVETSNADSSKIQTSIAETSNAENFENPNLERGKLENLETPNFESRLFD